MRLLTSGENFCLDSDALAHQYRHMATTQTTKLSEDTIATLGTWAAGPAKITASYHDETTVRIDVEGQSRVLTEQEWRRMNDGMRNAGYSKQ